MTNKDAAYLFLGLAVVLLITGIFSKKILWVFYISGMSWLGAGLFFITEGAAPSTGGTNFFVDMLGVFCVLAGVTSFFVPIMLREKTVAEIPKKVSHTEHLAIKIEESRRAGSRFRTRTGAPWEPPQ